MGFVKIKEATEITSLSKSAIYQLCKDKEIPHYNIAGNIRFDREKLESWVREQENDIA